MTFTTHLRQRFFDEWTLGAAASRALCSAGAWADSRLLCWILMPDHFHGLVELGSTDTLSRNVGRAKHHATRALRDCGLAGAVWARGFHERAMRREDNIVAAARYTIANPLRAGLVTDVGAYPYWNAAWLADATPI
ncbi:MAG TPA: transposase [Xanthomonadaceae bacterium]|nr:transposase [Xanthomonadaceae bacterium]